MHADGLSTTIAAHVHVFVRFRGIHSLQLHLRTAVCFERGATHPCKVSLCIGTSVCGGCGWVMCALAGRFRQVEQCSQRWPVEASESGTGGRGRGCGSRGLKKERAEECPVRPGTGNWCGVQYPRPPMSSHDRIPTLARVFRVIKTIPLFMFTGGGGGGGGGA